MDIAQLSTALSQGKMAQEAAAKVQKMALGTMELQGEGLQKLMNSPQRVTDPALGQQIDLLR